MFLFFQEMGKIDKMDVNKNGNFIRLIQSVIEKGSSGITINDVQTTSSALSTVNTDDLLFETSLDKLVEPCLKFVQIICEFGRIQEITGRDHDMVDASDFAGVEKKACESIKCLIIFIEKIRKSLEELSTSEKIASEKLLTRVIPTMATAILILAGEHHGDFMWGSTDSTKLSLTLTKALLGLCKCNSLDELFCSKGQNETRFVQVDLFGKITAEIKPRLKKDLWKKNPSLVEVFCYYLQKVSCQHSTVFILSLFCLNKRLLKTWNTDAENGQVLLIHRKSTTDFRRIDEESNFKVYLTLHVERL